MTTTKNSNLCRICNEKPAREDGVCRWEFCEKSAEFQDAVARESVCRYEYAERNGEVHLIAIGAKGEVGALPVWLAEEDVPHLVDLVHKYSAN